MNIYFTCFSAFCYLTTFAMVHSKLEDFLLSKHPIRVLKPVPINILSSEAINSTLSPLRFNIVANQIIKLTNNGHLVEGRVRPVQQAPVSMLTGGPYKNEQYRLHMSQFYWSGNLTGPAGTTINGANGAPIEIITFWYNVIHRSFEKAISHKNGLAVISIRINPDLTPNIKYEKFVNTLKKIKKAGSFADITIKDLPQLKALPPTTPYFFFPGYTTNSLTRKKMNCAIICVIEPVISSVISIKQYEDTFLSLMNKEGKRLTNSVSAFPQKDTPVVHTSGLNVQVSFAVTL